MRVLPALLTVGLLSSTAYSADILEPVVPVEPVVIEEAAFSWTGFYAGLNVGYGFQAGDDDDDNGRHHRRFRCRDDLEDEFCGGFRRFDEDDDDNELNGPFVGAQIGANYQTGMFVFGVEGDLQWSGIDTDNGDDDDHRGRRRRVEGEFDHVFFGSERDRDISVDWFGTARLRAGVAVDRALIYATGGFAFGGVDVERHNDFWFDDRLCEIGDRNCRRGRFDRDEDDSETEVGYSLGGGVEYAFTDNFTVGAEYQYISLGDNDDDDDDFDRRRRVFEDDFDGRHHRWDDNDEYDVDFHTIRVKANFLFGGLGG